ncbi:MAG: amidohydrolase family protein [Xanthomonadales bacterium]|nr:amidohydrolase family protein [Xanthomonadales bacterium]
MNWIRAMSAIVLSMITSAVAAGSIVIRPVNVISMSAPGTQENQAVVIAGGKIQAVGPIDQIEVPEGATVIDGSGKFLLPGLAEMHAHVPPPTNPDAMQEVLTLYLTQGITTARGMLGQPGHLKLRERLATGEMPGPRLYTSGPSLNGNSVSSAEQAAQMVRDQHAAGYDHLKLHPGLSLAEFDAIAAEANRLEMPYAGHVSADVGAWRTIESGQTCIDHLDGFIQASVDPGADIDGIPAGFFGFLQAPYVNEQQMEKLVAALKDQGTWVVPTESLMHRFAGLTPTEQVLAEEAMAFVSPGTRRQWQQSVANFTGNPAYDVDTIQSFLAVRLKMIKALNDAGVGLLLGSDAPQVFQVPGFSMHRELALYVEAGLTNFEALSTGTTQVAKYLGLENQRGQVRAGFDADLVLLDANPLDDISNTRAVHGVMVDGRWFGPDWRRQALAEIAHRHRG